MPAYQHHQTGLTVFSVDSQFKKTTMKRIRTCQESYDACQRHWKFMGFLHSVSDRNNLDKIGRILNARNARYYVIPYQADSFKREYGGTKKKES